MPIIAKDDYFTSFNIVDYYCRDNNIRSPDIERALELVDEYDDWETALDEAFPHNVITLDDHINYLGLNASDVWEYFYEHATVDEITEDGIVAFM